MVSVITSCNKKEYLSTCNHVKEMGLEKRPFRMIIAKKCYSLEMEITAAELMKLQEKNNFSQNNEGGNVL